MYVYSDVDFIVHFMMDFISANSMRGAIVRGLRLAQVLPGSSHLALLVLDLSLQLGPVWG